MKAYDKLKKLAKDRVEYYTQENSVNDAYSIFTFFLVIFIIFVVYFSLF